MRRYYAFEAEGVSDEVKAQLEKVEDVVEKKCESPEDCDKILDKIETQSEKFDSALKDMAGAAKSCKDGECSDEEMNSKIAPAAAELKNIAKSIGVASEGETLTEDDLKDSKAYLQGAKEIVEAKKDELESDSGSSSNGDDNDGGSSNDADEDAAAESWFNGNDADEDAAAESWFNGTEYEAATEGQSWQALKGVLGDHARAARKARSEAMKMAKAGDNKGAIAKLNEAKTHFGQAKAELQKLPKDMWDTASSWLNAGLLVVVYSFIGEGGYSDAPNKNVNVAAAINYLNRAMKKIDEKIASLKSGKATESWEGEPATEGQSWQALKGVLGDHARAARKARSEAMKMAKAGDNKGAIAKLNEAKDHFAKSKAELQKLPKDMWDTASSWLNAGWLVMIYSFIGEGGYDDAPNKNVNVAAAINYLNRAMKKIDEKIASLKSGKATESEDALSAFINACESAMVGVDGSESVPFLFD